MPRPSLRSTSFRKIRMKLPGGANVIKYFKRKPKRAVCAECGAKLSGVAGGRNIAVKRLSKGRKTVNRPYGGNLCPGCAREKAKSSMVR